MDRMLRAVVALMISVLVVALAARCLTGAGYWESPRLSSHPGTASAMAASILFLALWCYDRLQRLEGESLRRGWGWVVLGFMLVVGAVLLWDLVLWEEFSKITSGPAPS